MKNLSSSLKISENGAWLKHGKLRIKALESVFVYLQGFSCFPRVEYPLEDSHAKCQEAAASQHDETAANIFNGQRIVGTSIVGTLKE
jgi:hypothetical protein